ncbi:PEP-CTERM system associated protein [Thiorhodococcus drewsii AZ1]|uniref:PEP-CTERM system associated protein n=1 Tax=Thiorhodococcus drewsii AZ1 TaxID=765913 RepID=G2E613_9GAMM|nr:TIGR03016 family PEP-CTERM system-associated outer membrane protein [Thiorhodococcus drewsii]EGV28498.1 PEP-CTERM system associated protein [Thiorhodococcus drewsii AZ1]
MTLADPMTPRSALLRLPVEPRMLAAGVLMMVACPAFGASLERSNALGMEPNDSDALNRRDTINVGEERKSGSRIQLSKQLSTKLTYSDNLNSSNGSNGSKSGGFIWEVVPGFVLNADGRHLDVNIAYSALVSYEVSDDSGSRVDNRLQADLVSELYEDHLFLDLAVTGRQELIDSFASGTFDTVGLNGNNLQTSWTYRVKPSYRERFGRYSDLQVDLETNGVFYSDTANDDSQGYVANARLTNGPFWEPAFYELRAEYEEEQYQGEGTNRFASLQGDLGYRVDRRWRFLTSVGYEDNDYASLEDTSGPIWGLGLDWTPTVRTRLFSALEHHYYGWAPRFEVSHRSKRSQLTGRYERGIETIRSQRLQQNVYSFEDPFGEPTVPEFGTDPSVFGIDSMPSETAFISDRLELEYRLQTRRSTVTLGVSYETRDYELPQEDEAFAEGRFSVTRNLSSAMSATLLLRLNDRRRDTGENTTGEATSVNEYALDFGLSRRLSEHLSASMDYGFRNYEDGPENRVTASLVLSW